MKIFAKKALIGNEWKENQVVEVENGFIQSVSDGASGDLTAEILTPGLFDKHHHGSMGFECNDPDILLADEWLGTLLAHGVTNVLYTTSSTTVEKTRKAIAFAAKLMKMQESGELGGACIMGVHMEGPFLNPVRKGAMNAKCILPPAIESFEAMTGEYADVVRAITIAPEVPGAYPLAEALAARGVRVQAGHTDADYAAMEESVYHSFSGLTHTYNAMPGIHHRDPGPVVFGMIHDEMCLEAICDFVHLAAPVVKMFFRTKGPQGIAMISDAVSVAGLPDGVYGDTIVRDGRALTPSGGISGSCRQLDTGVANVVSLGIPMEDAIRAASTTPAEYLGYGEELGSIAPGKRACLTAWNKLLQCQWGCNGFEVCSCDPE